MTRFREPEPIGLFIVGGSFLGLWLMIALMNRPDWLGWGLLGAGIGAGLYGGKLVPQQARYVVWTLVGISIGGLVALALIRPHAGLLATLITLTGSAFLAAGIPIRARPDEADDPAPQPEQPAASTWPEQPHVITQGQSQYGQQQSVTVVRSR